MGSHTPDRRDRGRRPERVGLPLRTRIAVAFVLVALLPGLLIAGVLLTLGPSGGLRPDAATDGSRIPVPLPVQVTLGQIATMLRGLSGFELSLVAVIASVIIALFAAFLLWRGISRRMGQIASTAGRVAAGEWDQRLPFRSSDAIGTMVLAMNGMIDRLVGRAEGLERELNAQTSELASRSQQLATILQAANISVSISHETSAWRNRTVAHRRRRHIPPVEHLLQVAADQISTRFDLPQVACYLLDSGRGTLVLKACSSSGPHVVGLRLPGLPRRLAVDGTSAAAEAVETGEAAVNSDTALTDDGFDGSVSRSEADSQADLDAGGGTQLGLKAADTSDSSTFHEIALPLRMRGQIIGVLDVIIMGTPSAVGIGAAPDLGVACDDDIAYLQVVADQVGLALENAKLLAEAEERVNEAARLVQEERAAGWRELLSGKSNLAYVYDGLEVKPQGPQTEAPEPPDVVLPLGHHDKPVGKLKILAQSGAPLTPHDLVIAQVIASEATGALERARLFTGAQGAMQEMGALYRCSQALLDAQSPGEVLMAIANHVAGTHHLATSDEVVPGSLNCGLLLMAEDLAGGEELRVASAFGVPESQVSLIGQRWSYDRLPVLADVPSYAVERDDVIILETVADDDRLDSVSRSTLAGELNLQSALLLPLSSGPTPQDLVARLSPGDVPSWQQDDVSGRPRRAELGRAPVGWIIVGSTAEPYAFSERERRVYRSLGGLAATVLRNFQLLDFAADRARRAQLVGSISTRVRETLDMDLILQTALREIGEGLGISSIEVQMRRHAGNGSLTAEDDAGTDHRVGTSHRTGTDHWDAGTSHPPDRAPDPPVNTAEPDGDTAADGAAGVEQQL